MIKVDIISVTHGDTPHLLPNKAEVWGFDDESINFEIVCACGRTIFGGIGGQHSDESGPHVTCTCGRRYILGITVTMHEKEGG